ncbi:hypothetical protein [Gluconobacter japonicus]|uniref:hypothetical protein n=1 Tax=Gluconobacter japonicus TaxID=376620 RepID=UPI000AEC8434|nr:hypothetical protein [Gluconobacter japonicus]
MSLDFGNVSDWVQAASAVLALGASVFINKKSNDFSINRDKEKDKENTRFIIKKSVLSSDIILNNLKQRRSFLEKVVESSPYTMETGIDDINVFSLCQNSIYKCIEKCISIDVVESLFELLQCLDHIRTDLSGEKSVSLAIEDLNSWIPVLDEKIRKLSRTSV